MPLHTLSLRTALLVGGAILPLTTGCDRPMTMHPATSIPAGQGTISAKPGTGGNTQLEVRVQHLAPPSRVVADATVYVVWIQPAQGTHQNLGILALDGNSAGTYQGLTPHRRFFLSVTPEANATGERPLNEPVFTADVNRSE
jgi:hypothetical protein